ncbi:MAG: carbohydrate binding family 9 domain-containing protein [Gemmatimonadota bacterium]|nr:carbohydrate binding family 9 domain-containing protein [Gemmatimonadota bacterium]
MRFKLVNAGMLACVAAVLGLPTAGVAQDDDGSSRVRREPPDPWTLVRPDGRAVRRGSPIELDGSLDDEAWEAAPVMSQFVQREPVEGSAAVEDTHVRVLFDDEAIWIGLRMYDSDPTSIARQLYRRDEQGQADFVEVAFDPNLDRRTAYLFGVSAANVQIDEYLFGDKDEDRAWDAVWSSAVTVDDEGWTAELRIPLSQIRYEASTEPQTWGFNVHRFRVRSAERTFLSLLSRLRPGTVSQFGTLEGIRVDRAPRRVEVLPYTLASVHDGPAEAGDPFFDGFATAGRVGVDVSYGLGSAFTLDATMNPDFGQVEADPAVINLTAFETFFREQRPFFVEDSKVFDFGLSGGRNQLFYSRRIGRSPHGRSPGEAAFSHVPDNATILGAAKVAGRTSDGLSLGLLAAVTGREHGQAVLPDGSEMDDFLVEPRAEFGVLSLQQDLNGGASQISGMATAMRRDLPADGSFDYLASSAFNGGVRFEHQWNDREWALWGFLAGSHVRGDPAAITRIQYASNHYFQRPDATRYSVDGTATSMSGMEWRLQFERRSGRHWTGALWAAEVTKGFEINDVGYSQSSERLDGGARIAYREIVPGSVFRNYNVSLSTFHNWSHEALDEVWSVDSWQRARLRGSYSLNAHGQFLNYWNIRSQASYSPQAMSRSATRGGPMMVDPASATVSVNVGSDRRGQVSYGAGVEFSDDRLGRGRRTELNGNVHIRPTSRVEVSVEPRFEVQKSGAQYVTASSAASFDPTYGTRYLFADLDRKTVSMETRVNWTFSSSLSLQVFAQPLLSSGEYLSYKQLTAPETYDFHAFTEGTARMTGTGVVCTSGEMCLADGDRYVDVNGDGLPDFSFSDRDFNVRSLIGNMVLRWEYRPGSTIFLVWQRQQSGRATVGDFDLGRDVGALFDLEPDNRFIIKANYWLGL